MAIPGVQFVTEAWAELKKSTWLSRKEVFGSTMLVLILVLLLAVFIGSVDFLLAIFMGTLLGR
jgi:preprotein translocase subunit SecE